MPHKGLRVIDARLRPQRVLGCGYWGLPTGFYENPREARENIHGSSGWTGQTDMNLRGKFTFRMEAGESRLPRPPIRGCTMGMLCIAPCGL